MAVRIAMGHQYVEQHEFCTGHLYVLHFSLTVANELLALKQGSHQEEGTRGPSKNKIQR